MDPGNRSSLEELDTAATSVEDSGGSGDAEKLVPHRPRHQLIPQELEALKPVIKTLYIDNGLTFREVQQILHARYNYKPSLVIPSSDPLQFSPSLPGQSSNKPHYSFSKDSFERYGTQGWKCLSLNVDLKCQHPTHPCRSKQTCFCT